MPVVGMIIRSIEAKKTVETEGSVKVNNKTDLKEIREQDLPALGKNKKGLAIVFEFVADYEAEKVKDFGKIIINGDILYIDDDQDKVLKEWKKNKKIPEDMHIQIINAILRKCLTKAITLSEDLQLPPPIAMPFASLKKKEEARYIG